MQSRIGILGGMGPAATLYFLKILFQAIRENLEPKRDQDFPDMNILMESTMPDRTEAIKNDLFPVKHRINSSIVSLIKSNCKLIVIPCLTAHVFVEDKWFENNVLDLRNCILSQYKEYFNMPIGVIATDGSILSGVFNPISCHFDLKYPANKYQNLIMDIIYGDRGLKSSMPDFNYCKKKFNNLLFHLKSIGIRHFIAGCTEIEMFVGEQNISNDFLLPMSSACKEICIFLGKKI